MALQRRDDDGAGDAHHPVGEEQAAGVGHPGQTGLGHLEQAELAGRPVAVLTARRSRRAWWRSPSNESTVSTTCSSTRGPARAPSFVTWPMRTTATSRRLASSHQAVGRVPHLRHRPRRRGDVRVDQGLDGVDHDEAAAAPWPTRRRDRRLRQQPQRRLAGRPGARPGPAPARRSPRPRRRAGAPRARPRRRDLQEERRLADPRLAPDHGDRARDQAAAEHAIQLGQAGADRPGVGGHDLRDGAGGGRRPGASDRPSAASSTRVFHAPQDGQRPAHFGWVVPHSVHRFLLMSRQPTQGGVAVYRDRRTEGATKWTSQPRSNVCATLGRTRSGGAGGPYLSERQWGTVREDYSEDGDAWDYFTHDQARSRAYRWGEDGLAGHVRRPAAVCFALALWNGQDPILKERLFGLTNAEGNHGEDVKEYYFYLDNTPTHSYMRWLYKYPQAAFPYDDLVADERPPQPDEQEYELLDTGVFDEDRYFDVEVELRQGRPGRHLVRITVANRGPTTRRCTCCPRSGSATRGRGRRTSAPPRRAGSTATTRTVLVAAPVLGAVAPARRRARRPPVLRQRDQCARLSGSRAPTPYPKDGINDHVVSGVEGTVNPDGRGDKARTPGSSCPPGVRWCCGAAWCARRPATRAGRGAAPTATAEQWT